MSALHSYRCGSGCPHFDASPPAYLRVRPDMGLCRAHAPAARYARFDSNEVLPSFPWVTPDTSWCGLHPMVQQLARELAAGEMR